MNKLSESSKADHLQGALNVSRRGFLVTTSTLGAGLALGMTTRPANSSSLPLDEVNAWVHIATDDTVTIRIARSEMGQGTLTGLAQLVAEELDCDWDKVAYEFPPPGKNLSRDRVWGDYSTGGSYGLRGSQLYMREGGAAAKIMLLQAAADRWGVAASTCSATDSVITHGPSGRTTTYGSVAAKASAMPVPTSVTLRNPAEWRVAGKSLKRLDTVDKLTGKLIYGADINLPNMLCASIVDCPVVGGRLISFDERVIANMPGVKRAIKVTTAEGTNGVAVVADTWWQANSALKKLPVRWDLGPNAEFDDQKVSALLREGLTAKKAFKGNWSGDFEGALSNAATTVESTYKYPSQNHAPMEPMNATALFTEDRCEVWCPTQSGEAALAAVASASGLPLGQCEVHKTMLGGGFGRRLRSDFVHQAVKIAQEFPGTPVKLQWSREEDQKKGHFHPTTMARMRGTLDEKGNLTGLHMRISGQSILAGIMPQALGGGPDYGQFQGVIKKGLNQDDHSICYDIPNLLVDHAMRNPPIRPGYWRGVNINQNTIYMECFLEEMAYAAGRDPLEFRLALMKAHPQSAAVLRAVAEQGGWGNDDGFGRGLAVLHAFGSYVAACAEVSVDEEGSLNMHRIVAATDCGTAVNPQQIEAQVQGSFVYGLSAALYSQSTLKNGEMQEDNFHTYPSMKIAAMPKVEVIVMPSGGFFGGVGEPTIGVAAPAVLNAIFAATGKRVRVLPVKDQNLRA